MALVPAGSNQKPYFYEYASDADLVASVLAYGALASLSAQGFGSALGYVLTGADPANRLPVCFVYSRNGAGTAGRQWVVTQGTSAKCLVLIVEGSPNASGGGSSGADIVRVVAKSGTYTSPTLSSAVFSTIASAISGAPTNAAILILNDTYTESPTINSAIALVGFGNASELTINGTITANAALVMRNITVDGGASNAVTVTAGDFTAYDSSFVSSGVAVDASAATGTTSRFYQSVSTSVTVDSLFASASTFTGTATAAMGNASGWPTRAP